MAFEMKLSGKKPSKSEEEYSELLKEKPPSLSGIIDEVIARKKEKLHYFRPSMLHGCDRQNVFHYVHAPRESKNCNNRLVRILDTGTAIHRLLQGDYLADTLEYWFAPEVCIYKKINGAWVKGSSDGTMIRRSDLYRFGIEIKTINTDEFKKLQGPKPDHVKQASLYAKCQGLYWISILYFDKNNQNLKDFAVPYNEAHWLEMKERIGDLYGFVSRKELPAFNPATCDTTFCEYVTHCGKKGAPV